MFYTLTQRQFANFYINGIFYGSNLQFKISHFNDLKMSKPMAWWPMATWRPPLAKKFTLIICYRWLKSLMLPINLSRPTIKVVDPPWSMEESLLMDVSWFIILSRLHMKFFLQTISLFFHWETIFFLFVDL
jgi:hypothetical protein